MLYLSLYESTEDPHGLGLYKEIILLCVIIPMFRKSAITVPVFC